MKNSQMKTHHEAGQGGSILRVVLKAERCYLILSYIELSTHVSCKEAYSTKLKIHLGGQDRTASNR